MKQKIQKPFKKKVIKQKKTRLRQKNKQAIAQIKQVNSQQQQEKKNKKVKKKKQEKAMMRKQQNQQKKNGETIQTL